MEKLAQEEQGFQCRFCSKCFLNGKSLGGHMRCHLALISAARKKDRQLKIKEEDEGGGSDDGPRQISKNFSPVLSNSSFSDGEDDGQDEDQERRSLRGRMGIPKKSMGVSPNLVQSDDIVLRKLHRCKECFRNFPSARSLAGHMRTHSPKLLRNQEQEQDEHVCKTCGKGFDSVRALYGHMKCHSKRGRIQSASAEFDLVCPRKKRSVPRHRNVLNQPVSEEAEGAALGLMMLSKDTWDCNDKAEIKERDLDSCSSDMNVIVTDDPKKDASKCSRMFVSCCPTNTECYDSSPAAAAMVVSEFQEDPKNTEASGMGQDLQLVVSDRDLDSPDASKCNEDDGNGSVLFAGSLKRENKALGSHRNRSRMLSSCCQTNTECCSDTSPDSVKQVLEASKISREHECEICFKVFATGQALGGHKRAHYNANQDLRCVQNNSFFARQDGVGFKPWWSGNAALLT